MFNAILAEVSYIYILGLAMSGFFITGTDTDIGKTFVSISLIQLLADEIGRAHV